MTKKKKHGDSEVGWLSEYHPGVNLVLFCCFRNTVSHFLLCCFSALLSSVQLGWNPDPGCTSPHRWIPTPDQEEDQPVALMNAGFPHYNFNNIFTTPVRCAPLPTLW